MMHQVREFGLGALALVLTMLAPLPAQASAFRLQLADGHEVVGAISNFEDGMYWVATNTGERQFRLEAVKTIEPVTTTASIDPGARPERSGVYAPVPEFTFATSTSRIVVGRLGSFEDGVYEIQTRSGIVRLSAEEVRRVDLAWVERPPPPDPSGKPLTAGTVRLAGSDAMAMLHIPALVDAYSASGGGLDPLWSRGAQANTRTFSVMAPNGKLTVAVRNTGSAAAVDAFLKGEIDMALLSRRMLPEEAKRAQERGLGTPLGAGQEHELAPGGAVILVHPSNSVKALRLGQIADILAGRIRSWGDVGGTPRRIQVHALEEGAGTLDIVRSRLMAADEFVGTIKRVASNVEMSDMVASDQAAIGIAEYSYAGNAVPLALIDNCGRTIGPDEFSLQTREYFLSSPLYLYVTSKPTPATRAFLQFALSAPGQRALTNAGLTSFLPIAAPRAPVEPDRFAGWPRATRSIASELERFMTQSARISIAIGFAANGAALNADGEREISRLAAHLKAQNDGRRVVLLGHSDATGNLQSSIRVSERGAQLVQQKLKERAIGVERVFGLGPLLPLSCGQAPEARAGNYRVEAWMR